MLNHTFNPKLANDHCWISRNSTFQMLLLVTNAKLVWWFLKIRKCVCTSKNLSVSSHQPTRLHSLGNPQSSQYLGESPILLNVLGYGILWHPLHGGDKITIIKSTRQGHRFPLKKKQSIFSNNSSLHSLSHVLGRFLPFVVGNPTLQVVCGGCRRCEWGNMYFLINCFPFMEIAWLSYMHTYIISLLFFSIVLLCSKY